MKLIYVQISIYQHQKQWTKILQNIKIKLNSGNNNNI